MEPNDMLSSLLSDPQKLQSAIAMATSLLGGGDGGGGSTAPAAEMPTDGAEKSAPVSAPQGASPLRMPSPPATAMPGYDPSAALMAKAMPVISAIAHSGQTAVSREKANLLNSVKPFVAESIGEQIDHAMRLVSLARMARSAMKQLGGARGDDGTRKL